MINDYRRLVLSAFVCCLQCAEITISISKESSKGVLLLMWECLYRHGAHFLPLGCEHGDDMLSSQ